MDRPAEIKILCPFSGHELATKLNGHMTVKGQDLPTEGLDGVILRCVCGRLKTYFFREEKPVSRLPNTGLQDVA